MAFNYFEFCLGLFLSVAICFGIIGNIISYLIWTRGTRCKKMQGGLYLQALAISDTIALCIPATHTAVDNIFSVDLKLENAVFCKLENTGRHFGLLVSSWIIVCFTIERTVSLYKPYRSRKWFNKGRTRAIIVIIFLINFLLNIPYGIVYHLLEIEDVENQAPLVEMISNPTVENNGNITANYKNTTVQYKRDCICDSSSVFAYTNWYHIWLMDFVLIFVVPFTLITISNTAVLLLIVIRHKSKTLQSTQKSMAFGVTMRAVTVSIVHCITAGPFSVGILIPQFLDTASSIEYSPEYYADQSAVLLAYLNHAVNFVIYSFLGTDFRRDCAEIFCRKKKVIHQTNSIWSLRRSKIEINRGPDKDRF